MKNWGKFLHESQTNIWDVCVCVCVCVCAYVDDGRRGAKGSKVLSCLTQVQWLPIPNNLSRPWTTKKPQKFINWWNHEESISSDKSMHIKHPPLPTRTHVHTHIKHPPLPTRTHVHTHIKHPPLPTRTHTSNTHLYLHVHTHQTHTSNTHLYLHAHTYTHTSDSHTQTHLNSIQSATLYHRMTPSINVKSTNQPHLSWSNHQLITHLT